MAALIAAGSSIIVGILTLIGVIITNSKSNRDIQHNLEVSQAVTDTKIESLTTEVREHNNFAKRMPQLEQELKDLKEHDIKDLKRAIEELRKFHTQKN